MKRAAFGVTAVVLGVIAWRVLAGIKSNADPEASVAASTTAPLPTFEPSEPAVHRERLVAKPAQLASLEGRQFVDIRGELERRAAAGDGHAAFRLGSTLASCGGYVAMKEQDL
jgi:hypothetical protein